ncbi:MAG TPA: hypothetical protein PLY93_15665, partial [Turneriella sp.]|nr:hypothetical protein [Turneriella sp.]
FHNVRRFFFDATKISDGAHSLATREVHNSGGFHRILVDAPCSASGTLRRNPDVRFRILPHDIEKFAMTQLQILTNVHPYLKVGGKLIYTTCSVFREENESVVEKFLSAHTDFKRLEQKVVGSPHLDADTMFYAVLEKK